MLRKELIVTTYHLVWTDGTVVTVKVLAEGDAASVISVEGARERVASVLSYRRVTTIAAEFTYIALRDRAKLTVDHAEPS
jgi:hypothetical protein